MILDANYKYQIKIELENYPTNTFSKQCETHLYNNLDLPGFVKCHVAGKLIEIIFHPPQEITDKYVFETIEETLQEIGVAFLKSTLRLYVGNAARTLVASLTGGALGSRAGAAGAVLGLIGGALIEKVLFDWKNMCECSHDETGNLIITELIGNESI